MVSEEVFLGEIAGPMYTATKIPFMCSQKRSCADTVPISTFMCVIYKYPGLVHIFSCSRVGRLILGIHKSLRHMNVQNWDRGRAFLFLGIFVRSFGTVSLQSDERFVEDDFHI